MEGATLGTGRRMVAGVVVTAAGTPVMPPAIPAMGTSAAAEAVAPPVVGAVVTIPGTLAAAASLAGVGFRKEAVAAADCAAPRRRSSESPRGAAPGLSPFRRKAFGMARGARGGEGKGGEGAVE